MIKRCWLVVSSRSLILVLWVLGGCASRQTAVTPTLPPTVLVISLDGFRHDYLEKANAPRLKAFARGGIRARGLEPVFPSLTFPNHYSLATGLHAENHGIIANEMYDPQTKQSFALNKPETVNRSEWWEGEPFWVTAEKQGLKAATMFWVGSYVPILGTRPSYWIDFDPKFPNEQRIKQILDWLDLPEGERPRLLTLYIGDVDTMGHKVGPNAPELMETVTKVDGLLGQLFDGLQTRGILNQIDIFVVSDHGMSETSANRNIKVSDFFDEKKVEILGSGALVQLWPKEEGDESFIKRRPQALSHFKLYRKSEIPSRFHYRIHRRIPPFLAVADEGWYLATSAKQAGPGNLGAHGYDNVLPDMQGIFYASGPHLRENVTVEKVTAVDLYPIVCRILGLKPARIDGDPRRVRRLFK